MSFELISEQERQRKYDVTLRHIRATVVAAEKQEVLHILSVRVFVSVASDPQREIPMRRIAICSFSGSTIFFFTLKIINCRIFQKEVKLLNIKSVLILSTTFF